MAQRPDILDANGRETQLITRLLDDANTWITLRRLLLNQAKAIKEFILEYRTFTEGGDEFAVLHGSPAQLQNLGHRFDQFDAISAALIQLVSSSSN